MDMKSLSNNHMVHGLAIGSILYLITKNTPLSLGVGVGSSWYMSKYGHSFPSFEQRKPDHKVSLNNANSQTSAAYLHSHIALEKKDSFGNWMRAAF